MLSQAAPAVAANATFGQMTEQVQDVPKVLELLRSQPDHYVVASITGRTFVLALSDLITLPRLRGVEVGDVLELDRVHEVGSRNYTLRAQDPASGRRKAQGGRFPLVLVQQNDGDKTVRVDMVSTDTKNAEPASVTPFSPSWAAQLLPSGLAHVGATLPADVVCVRCVVVEHTKGPLERIVKFKRRKGYRKVITHKQPYTRVRVDALTLGAVDRDR
ncbi:hypothetical protein MVES1_000901 [Malassezia vespertilionis]|uniref:Large ribosomal subunit protein bL21m n=1 Tax=Malassezia vespertilionis TaxID=2020962 RepID=A0A2N1JDX1_9BASI|nr:uncharacterized protein MVES1_000901 [Malassezia vespertilionis]PKI84734.1 hypothetical protein MVES_000849 [Malassezia vespertilionis]WFD05571.1 hypothetical protein MVES1_000901 [Malassezia vespertilionis]